MLGCLLVWLVDCVRACVCLFVRLGAIACLFVCLCAWLCICALVRLCVFEGVSVCVFD